MAKNDILFVGALLFVLLFAYGVSFNEERVLKADHYEAFVADKLVRSMQNGGSDSQTEQNQRPQQQQPPPQPHPQWVAMQYPPTAAAAMVMQHQMMQPQHFNKKAFKDIID
ncbi:hypothetical protein Gotur_017837 [Gossypium turneri]